MQETYVRSLGWEDPPEKEMAIYTSTHAWQIPWTEEPPELQSRGSKNNQTQLSNWTKTTIVIINISKGLGLCSFASIVSSSLRPPSSSVHGFSQAIVTEWLAISFSRGISFDTGIQSATPATPAFTGRFFTTWLYWITNVSKLPCDGLWTDLWRLTVSRCRN